MIRQRRYQFVSKHEPRRGAIAALTAFMLVAIFGIAGLLLSLTYIEMANAELKSATDAAARSAIIRLAMTQSQDLGRAAAVEIAAMHRVGGQPLTIAGQDVVFGNSDRQGDGTYNFVQDSYPLNASRVLGLKTEGSASGELTLPFGAFIGQNTFETERSATAMRLDYDIVLVLDRSGSMGWDLSQYRFMYPGEKADRPLLENYFSPPHSTLSRWGVLASSVNEFLQILSARNISARVALVTFASDYEFGSYASTRVSLDSDFVENFTIINTAISTVGAKPVIGDTNISAGLTQAHTTLMASLQARPRTAQPLIVLFSDGIYTEGANPVETAQAMHDANGIIIHSVTFGAEAEAREMMNDVANVAGHGLSLHADTAEELISSFEEIANSIPVIVIR